MSFLDSPLTMASRLENQIALSESNSKQLIIQAETRLNARIHALEMKLIRRGVFSWPAENPTPQGALPQDKSE